MYNENNSEWEIIQDGYDRSKEDYYESIFSLGNGYMGVRGFHEEDSTKKSYETCSYIAGIYDYFKPGYTDLVNTPNFLYTRFTINNEAFSFSKGFISNFKRILNLKNGTLTRSLIWESVPGIKTKIESIRFLSMANTHNAAVRYRITPLNYSGRVVFETGIDSRVNNNPVNDDQLRNDLNPVDFIQEIQNGVDRVGIVYTSVITRNTGFQISEAFAVDVNASEKADIQSEIIREKKFVSKKITIDMVEGNEYLFDKFVAVFTSRDLAANDIEARAVESSRSALEAGFEEMLALNYSAWSNKWNISDIVIEGDRMAQTGIRYNVFQLIQANAENDPFVSIGARGIMHSRYKGCFFWDTEIFMFPFFLYTNTGAARNLLMYRYNTLRGAEENARMKNLEGARFAWMCSLDGREQCESWDIGSCEVHITADVAYAFYQYFEITGDEEFYRKFAVEILIKTAQYWKSRFSYDKEKDCYNMLFVKGPDEYCGVTSNNTYTSILAVNNMRFAIEAIQFMKEKYHSEWVLLKRRISFDEAEIDGWIEIINKAVVHYDREKKLYIEDDNFLILEPVNTNEIKNSDKPLYQTVCFDRLQRYRLLKQADVILLMTLLPDSFSTDEKFAAWNFYEPITLHDSSLSFGTHALMASRLGLKNEAYNYFIKSIRLDLGDILQNTGKEGIHFAALGASWQALVRGFAGIEPKRDYILINPILPEKWNRLKLKFFYRGALLELEITRNCITLSVSRNHRDLNIKIREKEFHVPSRECNSFFRLETDMDEVS